MAKYIKTMVDEGGNTIYPRTRTNAITREDGVTSVETQLAGLDNHTHDGRYYTETEVDTKDALKADKLMATNLVTNGDFSNGTTGWSAGNGTLAVTNGKALVTGTGASSSVLLIPSAGGASALLNDKVYISALVKVPTEADYVALQLYNNASTVEIPTNSGKPTVDTRLSTIYTLTDNRPILRGGTRCYFPSASASNGKTFESDNILLINLTQIFGAGLEPSKEQIDRLLSTYPNSWFNGTSELTNVKQLWNEKTDRILATNLVANGDFSNGTTGWGSAGTTSISVASNTLNAQGIGGATTLFVDQGITFISGRKYWLKVKARSLSTNCSLIKISTNVQTWISIPNPVQNQWYQIGEVKSSTTDNSFRLIADHSVDNLGKQIEIQYVLALDLTQIFGAGKEPTAVQMDNLLANFPNSWFNGTVELASLINILATKADKTQEAWITATLLSGWSGTLQYRKSSLGQLEIKGAIVVGTGVSATTIANLPSGYYSATVMLIIEGYNTGSGVVNNLRVSTSGAVSNIGAITTGQTIYFANVFPL